MKSSPSAVKPETEGLPFAAASVPATMAAKGGAIMAITVEAVYEGGVLKPAQPLPLKEREKVRVTVLREGGLAEQTYGLIGWKGDAATFDRILAEAEEGAEGRP